MGRKIAFTKNNCTSGEVSPNLLMRNDLQQYDNALAEATNVYVLPQGGVVRRPGQMYVDNTTTNQAARLVEFEFNTEQKYLLSFTPAEFKVYKDDVLQATVTSGVSGLTADIIANMTWCQSADTLLLFHPDIQPIKITRTSHTSWTAVNYTITNIPQYAFSGPTQAPQTASLTPSGLTGTITLTAGSSVFLPAHVGQLVYVNDGVVFITSYTSGTVVRGVTRISLTSTTASTSWILETGYEDVISATRGWPRTGVFYDGRLWLGGLKQRPQTLLGSKVGDFDDFNLGRGLDDEGIDITIDDDRVNAIYFLFPSRNLQVFTSGGEFFLPQELGQPITPSNVSIRKATLQGCSQRVRPVSIDGATLFIDNGGSVLRQFLYSDTVQNYEESSVSLLSSHLIKQPTDAAIKGSDSTYDASFAYMINNDGTVTVLTYSRANGVVGFSEWETAGVYEDVAVVGKEVYFTVRRTINGGTVRFIEKLNYNYFMDAAKLQTNGSPQTVWSNLSYLNGTTVTIRGDDYIEQPKLVSGGSLTMNNAVSKMEAGLNFSFTIRTLPLDFSITSGTTTRSTRRLVEGIMEVLNSREFRVNNKRPAVFQRFDISDFDEPMETYDGQVRVSLAGFDRLGQVTITQEQPLEFYMLGLVLKVSY